MKSGNPTGTNMDVEITPEVLEPMDDPKGNDTNPLVRTNSERPMKRAPDPNFGSKPLKKSYPNLSYSKTLNSLIWTLLNAVHKDETFNGLSVLEWAYKNVIGDGKTIPWGYFATELDLISTLQERYVRALQERGYTAEGAWPEICHLKRREWVFKFFLTAIYPKSR